jgi:hypothetical protein
MPDIGQQHRVIGIRHVLRRLKKAGLVEKDSLHAQEAVFNIQDKVLSRAVNWYKIGARRGALVILKAFLDGNLIVWRKTDGAREIIANVDAVRWRKKLRVKVGSTSRTVKKSTYRLSSEELDFE